MDSLEGFLRLEACSQLLNPRRKIIDIVTDNLRDILTDNHGVTQDILVHPEGRKQHIPRDRKIRMSVEGKALSGVSSHALLLPAPSQQTAASLTARGYALGSEPESFLLENEGNCHYRGKLLRKIVLNFSTADASR